MKHLILTATLFVVGACGSSVDNLANSINKATDAQSSAECDQKSDASSNNSNCTNNPKTSQVVTSTHENSSAGTNNNVTTATTGTSVSVTTSTAVVVSSPASVRSDADTLNNTSWVSACESGITYKASFAEGIETLTTNIYQDDACQVIAHSVNQSLTYAVSGDDIEFNEAAAGQFLPGAPFQIISTDGNTLSFSGNEAQVYTRL